MLALIGALTAWTLGSSRSAASCRSLFNIIWKLFDMVIGGIQAFIFALLTVLYFGMAGGHGDHDEHARRAPRRTPTTGTSRGQQNPNSRPERPARPHQRYTQCAGHPARNQGETVAWQ